MTPPRKRLARRLVKTYQARQGYVWLRSFSGVPIRRVARDAG